MEAGRKNQDPPTIHVIRQLADLMLGRITDPKYHDPASPILIVHVRITPIWNKMVDAGVIINIMKK